MRAKAISEDIKKAIIYQLFLPMFTAEGTLAAAAEMLPHIKETGATHVYLCPVCEHDDDTDESMWSDRQRASGFGNPKNPYRIGDYFKIEPNYGTDEDLTAFVTKAHTLGLKVMLDLVYFHCGPCAAVLGLSPDYVIRNEHGEPEMGEWHFPKLNFASDGLRGYLYSNMEYFVRKFDIDGFRMDVGDRIPLDFWENAVKKLSHVKPDLFMLNEGDDPAFLETAFECNYNYEWQATVERIFRGNAPASALSVMHGRYAVTIEDWRGLRAIETHDKVNDAYDNRIEKSIGAQGMDAIFVISFLSDGIPFIYNGNEICDTVRHSIFSDREHGKLSINWRNALTERGMRRMALIGKLSELRRSTSALYDGTLTWLDTAARDSVISFVRENGKKVFVFVNTRNEKQVFDADMAERVTPMLQYNAHFDKSGARNTITLLSYGYLVLSE